MRDRRPLTFSLSRWLTSTLVRTTGLLLLTPALASTILAATIQVSTVEELRDAIAAANPGDEIVLLPGTYPVDSTIFVDRPGAEGLPIRVRADRPGCAELPVTALVGFRVSAPDWTFEDLVMQGVCIDHDSCEHAFQIVGDADRFRLTGSILSDFNSAILANGVDPGTGIAFPDDVVIEANELFNSEPRMTQSPVAPIRAIGGRRWIVRRNFIHDFQKQLGNQISYGAILAGNGSKGLFEANIVSCLREGAEPAGVLIGLSFGGGGTSPDSMCEDGTCTPEHQDGILRNNLIINCTDVGIYLNEAQNSEVHHNTLYDTMGVDVRFPASVVDLRNNLLTGRIRSRDGAVITSSSNVEEVGNAAFEDWFVDPANYDFTLAGDGSSFVDQGELIASVPDDFCGGPRDETPDIGAVEYDADVCNTTSTLPLLALPPSTAAGPGNTLRLGKSADGQDVELFWEPGPDAYWNLYRDTDPKNPGQTLHQQYVPAPSTIDSGALVDGDPFYAYWVAAVVLCTDEEAP